MSVDAVSNNQLLQQGINEETKLFCYELVMNEKIMLTNSFYMI